MEMENVAIQDKPEKFRDFRKIVEALQAVSGEATICQFLYEGSPKDSQQGKSVTISVKATELVPLVEAIGMRLKWCQEQSVDRLPPSPEKPFSGDAVLDACSLLGVLSSLMEAGLRKDLPIHKENYVFLCRAYAEISELGSKVLARWEAIEGLGAKFRNGEISEEELEEQFKKIPQLE